ncbi:MAG: hypothetical protein AAGG51_09300 [Cyanobacteria bacterium P01_G01_bin.54]
MPQLQLIPGFIPTLFVQTPPAQQLTARDRYDLLAAMLTEDLEEDERQAIERLLRSVHRDHRSVH